jgi:pimeloyl-ACP methyl ester carboxylesterase
MKFYEYGDRQLPTIMLIHGGGNSSWMFEKQALQLQKEYCVILPVLDGHGEEKAITYSSTQEQANKIISYLDEKCGGHLFAIGGASLGAQIAMEVLSRRPDFIDKAILESGICTPKPRLAKMVCNKWMMKAMAISYNMKWMVRWSCRQYGWPEEMLEQFIKDAKALSFESNRNLYQTYLNYQIPESLSETKTKILLLYGSKEKGMMKKDVLEAAKLIPGSIVEELIGYNHCGFSLGNPLGYAEKLKSFLNT